MQQGGRGNELSKSESTLSPAIQPSSSDLQCPPPEISAGHLQTVEQSYDIIDLVDSDDESITNQSTAPFNSSSDLQAHMGNSSMH